MHPIFKYLNINIFIKIIFPPIKRYNYLRYKISHLTVFSYMIAVYFKN